MIDHRHGRAGSSATASVMALTSAGGSNRNRKTPAGSARSSSNPDDFASAWTSDTFSALKGISASLPVAPKASMNCGVRTSVKTSPGNA